MSTVNLYSTDVAIPSSDAYVKHSKSSGQGSFGDVVGYLASGYSTTIYSDNLKVELTNTDGSKTNFKSLTRALINFDISDIPDISEHTILSVKLKLYVKKESSNDWGGCPLKIEKSFFPYDEDITDPTLSTRLNPWTYVNGLGKCGELAWEDVSTSYEWVSVDLDLWYVKELFDGGYNNEGNYFALNLMRSDDNGSGSATFSGSTPAESGVASSEAYIIGTNASGYPAYIEIEYDDYTSEDRYWVDINGDGSWSYKQSEGMLAPAPTSTNDIYFTNASGNTAAVGNISANNVSISKPASGSITITGAIYYSGDLTINDSSNIIFNASSYLYADATSGIQNFTSNSLDFGLGKIGITGGGTLKFADNITNGYFQHYDGTVDTNDKTLTMKGWSSPDDNIVYGKYLNLGSSLIELNYGTGSTLFTFSLTLASENTTLDAGTSEVKITRSYSGSSNTGRDITFYTNGKTYYTIWNNTGGTKPYLTIRNGCNITLLKVNSGNTTKFESGETNIVEAITNTGTTKAIITSIDGATNATLTKSSGFCRNYYLTPSYITGDPDKTWHFNSTSSDGGNNSQLYFGTYQTKTLADTPHLTDSQEMIEGTNFYESFSDTISTNDDLFFLAPVLTKPAADEITLSDNVSTVTNYVRIIEETISLAEDSLFEKIIYFEIYDDIAVSDVIEDLDLLGSSIIQRKSYLYKVYDESGNFLEVWNDVISEPEFSRELNSVGSTMTIKLARNSDSLIQQWQPILDSDNDTIDDSNDLPIMSTLKGSDKIGADSSLNHNNRVDIYVFYGQTLPEEIGYPNGKRIFTGFISEININYGGDENTEVQLMSYGYDLDQHLLIDGTGKTTVAYNSVDPATIIRDGLTKFIAGSTGTYTSYTNTTVPLVNDYTVSYTFRVNTYKELLEKAVQLAPSGWAYYVGLGDNLVYFRNKPSVVNHYFVLGKHIKSLELRSYIGDVVNDVTFTGGKDVNDLVIYRRTTDTPESATRRGLSRISDSRVTNTDSADILARGEIDDKKNIKYRTTISIIDKTYDIESIELGDLIGFRNFNNFIDELTMQIVAINYTPDIVTLQLDSLPRDIPKRLEELRKAQDVSSNSETGDTPTQVT